MKRFSLIVLLLLCFIYFNIGAPSKSRNLKSLQKKRRRLEDSVTKYGLLSGASIIFSSTSSSQSSYCISYYFYGDEEDCEYWTPHPNDENPWFQVGFIEPVYFFCIMNPGSEGYSYAKIASTLNGYDWTYLNEGEIMGIRAPWTTFELTSPVIARAVRFYPLECITACKIATFDLLYEELDQNQLTTYLNTPEQIAAIMTGARVFVSNADSPQSIYGYYLDKTTGSTNSNNDYNENGWWVVGENNYIQIGLHYSKEFVRIKTKGSQDVNSYVKSYKIMYSLDGFHYFDYNEGNSIAANVDNTNVVSTILDPSIIARVLRIYPVTWETDATTISYALRIELYYLNSELENTPGEKAAVCSAGYTYWTTYGEIFRNNHFIGFVANQNNAMSSAYVPHNPSNIGHYIQLGMLYPKTWTKMLVKGREADANCSNCGMYASKITVQYTNDYNTWEYADDGNIYEGNKNVNDIVEITFANKFVARLIRIIMAECSPGGCAMQIEVFYEEDSSLPEEVALLSLTEKPALISGGYFLRSNISDSNLFGYKIDISNNVIYNTSITDSSPWVGISAGKIVKFTGFATRSWNTYSDCTYTLKYSLDGSSWNNVDSGAIFEGSIDLNIPVRNNFNTPIVGRALRIFPHNSVDGYFVFQSEAYYEDIALSEIYSTYGDIEVDAFQAGAGIKVSSYYYESDMSLKYRFGYFIDFPDNEAQGFRFEDSDSDMFFQFGVSDVKSWTSLQIQGAEGMSAWIETFSIESSLDGDSWTSYATGIIANTDETTIITISFDPPILARVLKLIPETYNTFAAFKLRPYYKEPTVEELSSIDLGLEVLAVNVGSSVEFSSCFSNEYGVGYHLNQNKGIAQCWKPLTDLTQWTQISASSKKLWTKIQLQGRGLNDIECAGSCEEYVTSYRIAYSLDGKIFKPYFQNSLQSGPTQNDAISINTLVYPLEASSIRIYPEYYSGHSSLRVEASFIERCDWRCEGCTISNDNTKCLACKTLDGLIGEDNGDGTNTCYCSSPLLDTLYENCVPIFISKFDFTTSSENLGNTGIKTLHSKEILINDLENGNTYDQVGFYNPDGYLVASALDILFEEEGAIFGFKCFIEADGSGFLFRIQISRVEYSYSTEIIDGYLSVTVIHVTNGKSSFNTFLVPEEKWFLFVLSFKNNNDGSSILNADLKIEGETSWEETYTSSWEADQFVFDTNLDDVVYFGLYLDGYLNTLEVVTFQGDFPKSREDFLHFNSLCLADSLSLGLEDNLKCTRCSESEFLIDLSNNMRVGYCELECPDGYFLEDFGNYKKCTSCPQNCVRCIGAIDTECQVCQENYYLNVASYLPTQGQCILSSSTCEKILYEYESKLICGPGEIIISGENYISQISENILTSEYNPSTATVSSYLWALDSSQSLDLSSLILDGPSITIPSLFFDLDVYVLSLTLVFEGGYSRGETFEWTVYDPVTIIIAEEDLEREYNIGDSFSLDASATYSNEALTVGCVLYDGETSFTAFTQSLISFEGKYFTEGTLYFQLTVTYSSVQRQRTIAITLINLKPEPYALNPPSEAVKFPTSQELTFEMSATPRIPSHKLTYSWTLSKDGSLITQRLSQEERYLTIEANSLENGATYTITSRAEAPSGYAQQSKTFIMSAAVDNSAASIVVSPTEGEAIATLFTFTISGFVDGEGGTLQYQLKSKLENEEQYSIFEDKSTSTSATARFEGSGNLEIVVTAYNEYCEYASTSITITLTATSGISDPSTYIQSQLLILDSDLKLEFIKSALSLIGSSDNLENEEINICGSCNEINSRGSCNTSTRTCECIAGYDSTSNCRYSDSEAEEGRQIISTILQEAESQYNSEGVAKGDTIVIWKSLSDHQDLLTDQQNQKIQTVMTDLSQETSNLGNSSSENALKAMSNLQRGYEQRFKQITDQDELAALRIKYFNLIRINSAFIKRRAAFVRNGGYKQIQFSNNSTLNIQKSISNEIERLKIGFQEDSYQDNAVEFPDDFKITSEDEPISITHTTFTNSPFPLSTYEESNIMTAFEADEEQVSNSTTELLSATEIELFQSSGSLISSRLISPFKIKFSIESDRRRLDF